MNSRQRIWASIGSMALLASMLTSCSAAQGFSDGFSAGVDGSISEGSEVGASASEIADYKDSMIRMADQEAYLLEQYAAVTGENFTDDLTLYNVLVDLVPEVVTFIGEMEEINPSAPNLKALHDVYLKAWNLQSKGMTLSIAALEAQDYEKIAEANEALSEGRALMRQFASEFEALG